MSEQPVQLSAAIAALSQYFVGDHSLGDTLTRVCEIARDAVPPAAHVGITMMVNGRPATAVFTNREVPEIDEAQYRTGDGPCLHAFQDGARYIIDSTREPGRWMPFRQAASAHGILSTLSMPMVAHDGPMGALNFYATAERAFTDTQVQVAEMFAMQAAFVLANAQAYWEKHELSEGLAAAMQSRAVIEQAKGIIISTMRCSADEAMEVLIKQSQHQNRKLRDVAADVVANAQRRR